MADKIIKEYRGIRDLVAAELITDTADTLQYGEVFPIAGIAELTRTTENSSEAHYYDNVAAIVIDSEGSDEVTCSCSAIPLDVLAKLTGQYYDSRTATLVEGEGTRKYFAIGYVTEDTDGNEVYVWRHKVKCSIPDSTHSTKNDGTDANGQELTFTGINTIHKFATTGKTAKAINHVAQSDIDNVTESKFFTEVYDIDKLVGDAKPSITLSTNKIDLKVGESRTITATVVPGNLTNRLTWYVDESKVTASGYGYGTVTITGKAVGETGVNARVSDERGNQVADVGLTVNVVAAE